MPGRYERGKMSVILRTVGPKRIPAIISPTTGGCLINFNPKDKIRQRMMMMMSWRRNTVMFFTGLFSSFKGFCLARMPYMDDMAVLVQDVTAGIDV